MSSKPKSHKAMGDGEWMARLRAFASSGVWPGGGGNRPAPRQRKWHDLYQKVNMYLLLIMVITISITYYGH